MNRFSLFLGLALLSGGGILVCLGVFFVFAIIAVVLLFFVCSWVYHSVIKRLSSRIELAFSPEVITILNPKTMEREFRRIGDAVEFFAAVHSKSQAAIRGDLETGWVHGDIGAEIAKSFKDAGAVNLVYGLEEVHLIATKDIKSARDFVACCQWALVETGH
jgi:hypothetical protein